MLDIKNNKELQEKVTNLVISKIKEMNYDFTHWYEYNFDTEIAIDESILKEEYDENAIETNYADFVAAEYQKIMELVAQEFCSIGILVSIINGFIDWSTLWDTEFDLCDFLEEKVKEILWNEFYKIIKTFKN